ncbi:MAG: hypothetical protein ABJB11_14700 [Ferruginibacter sp.]
MKTAILAIGRHEEILQTVLRILAKNEDWTAEGALTDEAAIQLFNGNDFDIVLLTSGITEECEQTLYAYFKAQKPGVIIIQHYGGGSGLLSNEILQALDERKL